MRVDKPLGPPRIGNLPYLLTNFCDGMETHCDFPATFCDSVASVSVLRPTTVGLGFLFPVRRDGISWFAD
jgi:hypothetical protein